jgi:vacuolar-type H+-ATPase subunit F/Vma7
MRPIHEGQPGATGASGAPIPLAYVGTRLDAAGFRLQGALALAPSPGQEPAALAEAMRAASVVLLAADVAERLPPALLEEALRGLAPLVAIVPQARRGASVRDPAERVRHVLGLAQAVQQRQAPR